MASIIEINGRWRAQVRRKGHAAQCKTFQTKKQAEIWARQIEADMDSGVPPSSSKTSGLSYGDVIKAYRELRSRSRPISDKSNEHYMLKKLEDEKTGLGAKVIATSTPQDLAGYAAMRKEEGAGPYTLNMEIGKLGTALRYGAAALNVALPDIVGAARPLLSHLRLIGGGNVRERRPEGDELSRIYTHLRKEYGAVYADAVLFAAVSTMRRGEVCTISRDDLDREAKIIPVWRKHPRRGKVLERVPLLPLAMQIIDAQPVSEPRIVSVMTDKGEIEVMKSPIFPVHPQTLTKYFTQTCRDLGIPDLHLHDMRHEGTSQLFELGYDIPEVAMFTGHKDWRNLKRYTNLRPETVAKDAHAATVRKRSKTSATSR